MLPIEIRRQLAAGDSPRIFVRGEEIGIVMVVLGLWVSAMALFFHRWGKIRMLEPYQPAYHKESLPGSPTTSRMLPPMNPVRFQNSFTINNLNDLYSFIFSVFFLFEN